MAMASHHVVGFSSHRVVRPLSLACRSTCLRSFATVESSTEAKQHRSPSMTGVQSWWNLTTYMKTFQKNTSKHHYKALIVGGGSGGLSVASHLRYFLGESGISVIEPHPYHYYQSGWTFVGAGMMTLENTRKAMSRMIPKDVVYHKTSVVEYKPDEDKVILANGKELTYDYLIVATGISPAWDEVKGLKEAMGKDGVTTNYLEDVVQKTASFIRGTTTGNAIFTMPPANRIKCPGAPQKIMYLADQIWREDMNVRQHLNVKFISANPTQFAVKHYADRLNAICDEKNIERTYGANLTAIDGHKRKATFTIVDGKDKGKTFTEDYTFIHVSPPMSPPLTLRNSPLVNKDGFVDVDKHTLMHNKYNNVFSLGDCSSVPTSKTASAIGIQARAVCQNILNISSGSALHGYYSGYASCPILVAKDKVILAEFNAFTGDLMETFPIDQSKPSRFSYFVKRYAIPAVYWNFLMRGIWPGNAIFRDFFGFFRPQVQESVVGHRSGGGGA